MDDTIKVQENNTASTETQVPSGEEPTPTENVWMSFMPMILIFIVFYFLLIRPQDKKRREHEQLISGVKKGEEVMTSSGIFGQVVKINDNDNSVILAIAPKIEIKIAKSAILEIRSRNAGNKNLNDKNNKDSKIEKKSKENKNNKDEAPQEPEKSA
jgi:preprotein translocase subunit YajC